MDITVSVLRELVIYYPETGEFIWKRRDRRWFSDLRSWATWNSRFSGRRAGADRVFSDGYRVRSICINNRAFLEHRLAWLYMTEEIPPAQLDHINRIASDNRWANLRDGTFINNRNRSMPSNNTSGVTGVSFIQSRGKWQAETWGYRDGKKYRKYIGIYSDIRDAEKAIKEFRLDNGYDPMHGVSHRHPAGVRNE